MNNKGFIMPTILAFIIITSSALLYQSISVVGQLYSLKAEVNDLTKLEYAVNTKRVIDSLEFKTNCKYKRELDYTSEKSSMQIASNCIYTETENEEYNQLIAKLLEDQQISKSDYQQLEQMAVVTTSQIDGPEHESELGKFVDKYVILLVEYQLSEPQAKIIVVDSEGNIIKNTSVK